LKFLSGETESKHLRIGQVVCKEKTPETTIQKMMTNMVESFHFKEILFQHLNVSLETRVASQ